MSLQEIDSAIYDLIQKAEVGNATQEELNFLFNLNGDLGTLLQEIMFQK